MEKVIAHKFYLKHTQNGVVLIFTIFLLLIISILTITFFYLQFLEADLIAHETEYLQAFYLAEAGLENGIMAIEDPNTKTNILKHLEKKGELKYKDPVLDSCTQRDLASDKQGIFYYEYKLNPNFPEIKGIITITGTGWVNDKIESKSKDLCKEKKENRREIEKRFKWQGVSFQAPEDWPGKHFGPLVDDLDYPVVMSRYEPKLEEVITFIKKGHGEDEEVSKDQSIIKLFSELTPDQRTAYNEFNHNTKSDITQARNIKKNDNELLFPEERRHLYTSAAEGISPEHLSLFCGKDCPFKYTEYRKTQGGLTRISSSMILKSNREFILKEGLYFFEELTLEKDSTLNTDGDVLIYVKKLELKQNAKLMGGTSTHPDKAKPNDLIILAQRWDGAYYDPEDGVKIGPVAKVYGHIFAPDLKVRLSRGSNGKETRVHGSILTYQLVTYIESGGQSEYGPIQIIYEEYLDESLEEEPGSWREVRNP